MGVPHRIVKLVLERDGFECMIAGPRCLGVATEPDHRANRGMGGSTVLDKPHCLIAACGICNGDKTAATGAWRAELVERGVIVEKAATNRETALRCMYTPVVDRRGRLWFLLPSGTRVESTDPWF